MTSKDTPAKQLPHLVLGGELVSLDGAEFKDLDMQLDRLQNQ